MSMNITYRLLLDSRPFTEATTNSVCQVYELAVTHLRQLHNDKKIFYGMLLFICSFIDFLS